MIPLNLALGLIPAGVLLMLDTIARHRPMESFALPVTALLVGALLAGRFLPPLLSSFWPDRKTACTWQSRTVLLVALAVMTGSLLGGPELSRLHPEESMRLTVRACVWGLGLVGCWLSIRQSGLAPKMDSDVA